MNFWINVDFCPSVRCREKALTLLKLASDSGRRRPSSRFALLVTQTLPKFIWEEELLVLLHILNWYFWFDCKKEQTVIEVGPFFLMLGRKLLQQLGKQGGYVKKLQSTIQHTVRKFQIMSKKSIFRKKWQNCEFEFSSQKSMICGEFHTLIPIRFWIFARKITDLFKILLKSI